eukprot:11782234-Alexandrium_andersonii.AAC.1
MSASLVGSEMCIRDRQRPQLGPRQDGGEAHVQDRGSIGPSRKESCSVASVSYTHLTLPTICSV